MKPYYALVLVNWYVDSITLTFNGIVFVLLNIISYMCAKTSELFSYDAHVYM